MNDPYKFLISTEDLFANLESPNWVILDCRFDLTNPSLGQQNYLEKHIPKAIYAHLDRDLSGPLAPHTGRHPLPEINVFAKKIGSWGISNASQVVVYDSVGGAMASRLWWMLRYVGHQKVAVLDGGFGKWEQAGYPTTSVIQPNLVYHFEVKPNWAILVNADTVEQIRMDSKYCLIDARTRERYNGENEPIDPIAGHIPGAINRFHGLNLTPDGYFKPAKLLREEFQALIGDTPLENVIVYCGSGVTSCHHLVAMGAAGLHGSKLYLGSWSEWIRDPQRPIAKNAHE